LFVAGITAISTDAALDTATAAQLHRVSELVHDASARLMHVLMVDARIGPHERRQLEDAAQSLRCAMEYFDRQTHLATTVESEGRT
jgi:hypothetical protein